MEAVCPGFQMMLDWLYSGKMWLESLGRFFFTIFIYVVSAVVHPVCRPRVAYQSCSILLNVHVISALGPQIVNGVPGEAISLLPTFPVLFLPNPVWQRVDLALRYILTPFYGSLLTSAPMELNLLSSSSTVRSPVQSAVSSAMARSKLCAMALVHIGTSPSFADSQGAHESVDCIPSSIYRLTQTSSSLKTSG